MTCQYAEVCCGFGKMKFIGDLINAGEVERKSKLNTVIIIFKFLIFLPLMLSCTVRSFFLLLTFFFSSISLPHIVIERNFTQIDCLFVLSSLCWLLMDGIILISYFRYFPTSYDSKRGGMRQKK